MSAGQRPSATMPGSVHYPLMQRFTLEIVVPRRVALRAFERARTMDVDLGGVYDARSAAINIWSHPWTSRESKMASEIVGTLYVWWNRPDAGQVTLVELEVERPGSRAEMWRLVRELFDLGPEVSAPWERKERQFPD